MAKQYLTDSCGEFVIDRKSPLVVEQLASGRSVTRASGKLSFSDVVNENNRIYPRRVWELNLEKGSSLVARMQKNRAFGLLEHPEDGKLNLQSPISHVVTDVKLESDGSVSGNIVFCNTPEGQKMVALIEVGYNPTVSSRGYGSLIRNPEGVDVVQDDYVCEGWDCVLDPGFTNAETIPSRQGESKTTEFPATTSVAESISSQPKALTLAEAEKGAVKPAPVPPKARKIMDASNIRHSLLSIALVESCANPETYAKAMAQLEQLHHAAEAWNAEDPAKNSWETKRLHEEISKKQDELTSKLGAVSTRATQLQESNTKVIQVAETVVNLANRLKARLAESMTTNGRLMEVNAKNLSRGRSWKALAESRGVKLNAAKKLDEKYEVATLGLSIMAKRYKAMQAESNQNILRLGRRVLQLEFAAQIKENADLGAKIAAAKTADELGDIRESIEKGISTPAPATPAPSSDPVKESKKVETTVSKVEVIVDRDGPMSVAESIGVIRRMSHSVRA